MAKAKKPSKPSTSKRGGREIAEKDLKQVAGGSRRRAGEVGTALKSGIKTAGIKGWFKTTQEL